MTGIKVIHSFEKIVMDSPISACIPSFMRFNGYVHQIACRGSVSKGVPDESVGYIRDHEEVPAKQSPVGMSPLMA